ncbi:MAG: hypothetical protein ACREJF_07280 [Candidatus Methylomirabilales bacterium]
MAQSPVDGRAAGSAAEGEGSRMGSSRKSRLKIGMTLLALALPAVAAEPGLEAFLGTWDGRWDDRVGTTLVVEKIEGNKARVIYRRDAIPRSRLPAVEEKTTGTFVDNKTLKVKRLVGGFVTYVLTPAGSLAVEVIGPDGLPARASMRKR